MKRFVNERDTLVTEALDGSIAAAGAGRLKRLDGYPHTKVVVRANIDPGKVAVISGGGAGHEPAHAGFVGQGLLTAAVSGEIFASPTVDAVLAGIQAVTGGAGYLIVKNYTGDRLNFGLAAETAKQTGLQVEMVIVSDDIAIPGSLQPRGVAGTLFVHKVAGYLAEAGASLAEVAAAARATAERTVSLGVALSSCTLPFQPQKAHLGPDEGELGLGIHGEPGVERIELMAVRSVVTLMAERLQLALPDPQARYALLVNNLGSVPAMEMAVVTREIMLTPLASRIDYLFGPAPLMTSLDMNGFSLSLVALDDARCTALLAPVQPAAWPGGVAPASVEIIAMPGRRVIAQDAASDDPAARSVLTQICQALVALEAELNALDAKVGDGDTGSTFAGGARALLTAMDSLPLADDTALCRCIAALLTRHMGGSSGVLLSILLTATATARADGRPWPEALDAGLAAVQHYGGAAAGDRTMLDALLPAAKILGQGGSLRHAADAAASGARATAEMAQAGAGRSAYLDGRALSGVPDPGAVAAATVLDAMAKALA